MEDLALCFEAFDDLFVCIFDKLARIFRDLGGESPLASTGQTRWIPALWQA